MYDKGITTLPVTAPALGGALMGVQAALIILAVVAALFAIARIAPRFKK